MSQLKFNDNFDNFLEETIRYWKNMDEVPNRIKEFIKKLYAQGKYRLILFSTRNLLLCAKWLIDNELDIYFYDITNVKTKNITFFILSQLLFAFYRKKVAAASHGNWRLFYLYILGTISP